MKELISGVRVQSAFGCSAEKAPLSDLKTVFMITWLMLEELKGLVTLV